MHNVAKHSHATSVVVELRRLCDDLELTISDNGDGFDTHKARSARGLGLASMRERIHLIGGQFEDLLQSGRRNNPGEGPTGSASDNLA